MVCNDDGEMPEHAACSPLHGDNGIDCVSIETLDDILGPQRARDDESSSSSQLSRDHESCSRCVRHEGESWSQQTRYNVSGSQGAGSRQSFWGLVCVLAAVLLLVAAACYMSTPRLTGSGGTVRAARVIGKTTRKYLSYRVLDEEANDDEVNDDEASEEEDESESEESQDEDNEADDDANNDDQEQHDDAPVYVDDDFVDDFYAYQEDAGPSKLLPITATDVLGFVLASMAVTLCAGGGIGGGGILVPVYIIVMQLPPREAIPLSAVTVMAGAMASTLVNARRRHPVADRPIIDWDLILVMEPLILVGALIGTLVHRVLSEQILVVMLVIFLTVTARTILLKAHKMHRAETKYIGQLKSAHTIQYTPTMEMMHVRKDMVTLEPTKLEKIDEKSSVTTPLPVQVAREKEMIRIANPDFDTLRSDLLEEEKVNPRQKILAICGGFSILIFLNVMVGGGGFVSPWGIRCGGIAFWIVHVIIAAYLVAGAWVAQTYLVNRHEIKELVNFDFVHGDIQWDQQSSMQYPFFFCGAGLCAGMFGIGGGMVVVPLLLAMGVHPAVATATSSCMTLFTSISATTSFMIYGLLPLDYAAVCLAIGFFSALFGQKIMSHARKAGRRGRSSMEIHNFERNSLIAYAIGGAILISALLMTFLYVLMIVSFNDDGDNGGICAVYTRMVT